MAITPGQILWTRDGKKMGNAIVLKVYKQYYLIKTDFGNTARLDPLEMYDLYKPPYDAKIVPIWGWFLSNLFKTLFLWKFVKETSVRGWMHFTKDGRKYGNCISLGAMEWSDFVLKQDNGDIITKVTWEMQDENFIYGSAEMQRPVRYWFFAHLWALLTKWS